LLVNLLLLNSVQEQFTVLDKSNGGGYATLFFVDSITVSRFGCLFTIPN
jgi:hypothetical protein